VTDKCKDHSMISDMLGRIDKRTESMEKQMNGNGKLGICAKVNIMWVCSVFVIILIAKELWNLIT